MLFNVDFFLTGCI